jgi:hypothetical protein
LNLLKLVLALPADHRGRGSWGDEPDVGGGDGERGTACRGHGRCGPRSDPSLLDSARDSGTARLHRCRMLLSACCCLKDSNHAVARDAAQASKQASPSASFPLHAAVHGCMRLWPLCQSTTPSPSQIQTQPSPFQPHTPSVTTPGEFMAALHRSSSQLHPAVGSNTAAGGAEIGTRCHA